MKVEFDRTELAGALKLLNLVTPANTPKPILKCVKISASDTVVNLYATDLEVSLDITMLAYTKILEPGNIVVPADTFSQIVRENKDDTITVTAAEGKCEVTGSDSHYTLYGQDTSQYPGVGSSNGEPHIEVAMEDLQRAVQQCVFVTTKESGRYGTNGVLWELKNDNLTLVATDGHRLAMSKVPLVMMTSAVPISSQTLAPRKAMSLLSKISSDDGNATVTFAGNQIIMRYGNIVLSSYLLADPFPKYEDIIPANNNKSLSLNAATMLSAVRRAALLTDNESRHVIITLENDCMSVGGSCSEGDSYVTLPVEYEGQTFKAAFNANYIIDALKVVDTPEFVFELKDQDTPAVIKTESDFTYVLMPMAMEN